MVSDIPAGGGKNDNLFYNVERKMGGREGERKEQKKKNGKSRERKKEKERRNDVE